MKPRWTIGYLMVGVVLIALGFAALRSPSPLTVSLVYTFTWAILLASILAWRVAGEPTPSFWAGFAVFGIGHQLLAKWPVDGCIGGSAKQTDSSVH